MTTYNFYALCRLEILDEEGYSFDCHWFENDEKRQKFIIENNIYTN
jgi:hypothetical protein